MEQFDKSIEDCDRAIEVKSSFIKVKLILIKKAYYRKALALKEQLKNKEAINILEKAIEIDNTN